MSDLVERLRSDEAGLAAAKARGRVGGRRRTVTPEQEAQAIAMLRAGVPFEFEAEDVELEPEDDDGTEEPV